MQLCQRVTKASSSNPSQTRSKRMSEDVFLEKVHLCCDLITLTSYVQCFYHPSHICWLMAGVGLDFRNTASS